MALIPIKTIDMDYSDLFYGCLACANPFFSEQDLNADIVSLWGGDRRAMVTLSVRSGFYLFLEALALPAGSEVIMSGITIPDMPRIVEKHGLKVVPVDLSMRDLGIKKKSLDDAITNKTRLVIVAHLYGAIIDMQLVRDALKQYPDIRLIEDCAQAFSGINGYRGQPGSDVLMYSFGTIKTATALGGSVFLLNDSALLDKMLRIQQSWDSMSCKDYVKKLFKGLLLKLGSVRIFLRGFIFYCGLTQKKPENVILGLFRGFPGDNFFQLICRRPPAPLLAMLKRRLLRFDQKNFTKRVERFNYIKKYLTSDVFIHGIDNATHSNWVCAVSPENADEFVQSLRKIGVFCFLGSPQIKAISGTICSKPAPECAESCKDVVYVPIAINMSDAILMNIAKVMNHYA